MRRLCGSSRCRVGPEQLFAPFVDPLDDSALASLTGKWQEVFVVDPDDRAWRGAGFRFWLAVRIDQWHYAARDFAGGLGSASRCRDRSAPVHGWCDVAR